MTQYFIILIILTFEMEARRDLPLNQERKGDHRSDGDDEMPDWMTKTQFAEVEFNPKKLDVLGKKGGRFSLPVAEELDESDEEYYGCEALTPNARFRCVIRLTK